MAKAFCHVVDTVNQWVGKIFSLLILPMLVLVGIEVVARYAFNRPTIFIWDVNVQLLCAIMVLGAGYALLTRGHVMVDVLVTRFSPRTRAIIDLVTALFFFFCIGALVWQAGIVSWQSFVMKEHYSSVWEPPLYPLRMMIPVGAFLLLLQGIAKFIRDLADLTRSKEGPAL